MFHEGKSPVSGPNNSHTPSTNTECQYTAGTVLGAGGSEGKTEKPCAHGAPIPVAETITKTLQKITTMKKNG